LHKKIQDHLLKICIFASQEICLICFITLLLMFEKHGYIADFSITRFENEIFKDLVVLETKSNRNFCC